MSNNNTLNNKAKEIALDILPKEILRCEIGSSLHGISSGDGDLDLMGVMLEPDEVLFGTKKFEQTTRRSAIEGKRSGPDDVDLNVYGLKKWMRLALSGNPSVIVLLYAPKEFFTHITEEGKELIELRNAIASKHCIGRFLGYHNNQRRRALSNKSSGRGRREGREEKWASHMVRLCYQGIEMAETGQISLPMPQEQAETCRAIRNQEISLDEALEISNSLAEQLTHYKNTNNINLPDTPDLDSIHAWMKQTYLNWS